MGCCLTKNKASLPALNAPIHPLLPLNGAAVSPSCPSFIALPHLPVQNPAGCYFSPALLEPAFKDPQLSAFLCEARLRHFMVRCTWCACPALCMPCAVHVYAPRCAQWRPWAAAVLHTRVLHGGAMFVHVECNLGSGQRAHWSLLSCWRMWHSTNLYGSLCPVHRPLAA